MKLGRWEVPLPASPVARIIIGSLLLLGGCLWFLPVLGLWMIPLGLVVLSIDLHLVRRFRRRAEVRWGRRKAEASKEK
jgi:hypothetical protein